MNYKKISSFIVMILALCLGVVTMATSGNANNFMIITVTAVFAAVTVISEFMVRERLSFLEKKMREDMFLEIHKAVLELNDITNKKFELQEDYTKKRFEHMGNCIERLSDFEEDEEI